MEEKKNEEEVAGGKAHAKKTSDEKEESEKSGNAVVAADRTVEIEGRLKDMSIKGGGERGNDQPARKEILLAVMLFKWIRVVQFADGEW
ncbi:hypothetical protein LWI29_030795 [Acer saccharum]|uniref:Uncharacterized protein n=1 Tax=Acer saccharum TaxID=4024 RepID=A0AA39VEI5_ACESA|nr:hypothetical protein LWI29_030795 [Acer saccharum]